MEEFWTERYELVVERMRQMQEEQMLPRDWQEYFATEAEYAEQACDYLAFVQDGGLEKASLEALLEWNSLFNRLWKSPQGECAPLMDLLSEELRSLGLLAAQERSEEFLIRLELFVEIYGICVRDWQEEKKLPEQKSLRECLYWYLHDYADTAPLQEQQYVEASEENPVYQLLQEADLDEEKYLYRYGIPVTDRELALWEWTNRLALEEVESWAGKLAEEIVKVKTEGVLPDADKRILLQYPVGYEKVVLLLLKKLQEQGTGATVEVAGKGVLLNLFEKDFPGRKVLWDKALAKRCREIQQTIVEKAEKEKRFCFAKVVLKEDKNDILKPHVVSNS